MPTQQQEEKHHIYKIIRKDGMLSFGLFAIFFCFYLGAAFIQTPTLKSIATLSVLNVPLGLLLSLLIFPVSWIIIFIWFRKGG